MPGFISLQPIQIPHPSHPFSHLLFPQTALLQLNTRALCPPPAETAGSMGVISKWLASWAGDRQSLQGEDDSNGHIPRALDQMALGHFQLCPQLRSILTTQPETQLEGMCNGTQRAGKRPGACSYASDAQKKGTCILPTPHPRPTPSLSHSSYEHC